MLETYIILLPNATPDSLPPLRPSQPPLLTPRAQMLQLCPGPCLQNCISPLIPPAASKPHVLQPAADLSSQVSPPQR